MAEELDVNLDTMLYRIKTFIRAGLLHMLRLERRVGRSIKHYMSVYDAYIIPFELTPHANLEETLHLYFRECAEHVVPPMARTIRQIGREGRILYCDLNDGDVWQSSANHLEASQSTEDQQGFIGQHSGPVAEFMDDTLELTDAEARELLTDLYEVWRRYKGKKSKGSNRSYFIQFVVVSP